MSTIKIFSQIEIEQGDLDLPTTATASSSTLSTVLGFVFAIGAGIAMIVIIIAGIQFILSQGDPEKAKKARNAIIYAGVGLALCATAFSIVTFVLGKL